MNYKLVDKIKLALDVVNKDNLNWTISLIKDPAISVEIPNPNYNPSIDSWGEHNEEFYEPEFNYFTKHMEEGYEFVLNKCKHSNYNFKIFRDDNDVIHFKNAPYLYGAYSLECITALLFEETTPKNYRDWLFKNLEERKALHNYKIDSEELNKLGITFGLK